ncbi:MAG: hypothetical protein V4664_04025 [Patescibacteria group bacterium]
MKHPKLRPAIIWETHEYLFQEKTTDWYWAAGIISVSLAVLSIFFGNVLLALLILIGGFALCVFGARRPNHLRFEINHTGLLIDRTLYPYKTLDSFWVENNIHLDLHSKVIFKSKRIVTPLIVIPLEEVDPEMLRDFLLDHLPEEEHSEPLAQKLLELLGF